jgi:hypothetical protein
VGHCRPTNDLTDDDLFLNAVDAIVLDAPASFGNEPRARFAFFKRLLPAAQEAVAANGGSLGRG